MPIAVTGARGTLGREVVAEFSSHGYEVVAIDREPVGRKSGDKDSQQVDSRVADLTDPAATQAALRGCDAVLHVAAIPNPRQADGYTIFSNNTCSTYCVLEAATVLGIRRVVHTSSQSALGSPWAPTLQPLDYIPVDEEHPCRTCEAYGLSKLVAESICQQFVHTGGLQVLSLRLPALWPAQEFRERIDSRLNDQLQAAKSMWAYLDMRDAVRAHRLALEAEWNGHEIANITTRWAFGAESVPKMLAQWYPDVSDIREELAADTAVFDWQKAERLLGFRSRYRWSAERIIDMGTE